MASVYRTYVFDDGRVFKARGTTVAVDDRTYVKREYLDELHPSEGWMPTQEAADRVAAMAIEKKIAALQTVVAELTRPLPAEAAAHVTAAGRAHAEVAT